MGQLYCFGLNDMSQCGIRSEKNDFLLLPVHVNLENDVSLISTTVGFHELVIKENVYDVSF